MSWGGKCGGEIQESIGSETWLVSAEGTFCGLSLGVKIGNYGSAVKIEVGV